MDKNVNKKNLSQSFSPYFGFPLFVSFHHCPIFSLTATPNVRTKGSEVKVFLQQ
jgi:hypothetical protein